MQRKVKSEAGRCSQGTFTCSCHGNTEEGTEESDMQGTVGQPEGVGSASEAEERRLLPEKWGQKHSSLLREAPLHFILLDLRSLELTPFTPPFILKETRPPLLIFCPPPALWIP